MRRHFAIYVPHIGKSRPLGHFFDGYRHLVAHGESAWMFQQAGEHEWGH